MKYLKVLFFHELLSFCVLKFRAKFIKMVPKSHLRINTLKSKNFEAPPKTPLGGGAGGGGRKLWCLFETFQTIFSPKYGKNLKYLVIFFFGKMTQNYVGKRNKLLGKWSNLLGKCSKLLGKGSIFLGKWSNFDGEMKKTVGKMKQNLLGRCPKGKVQHPHCQWTNLTRKWCQPKFHYITIQLIIVIILTWIIFVLGLT